MNCKDCRHMQVPKNGMANCAKEPDWKYMSLRFDRNCRHYQVATEAEIQLKRKQWRKQNGKQENTQSTGKCGCD